jgi:hypothetical protein
VVLDASGHAKLCDFGLVHLGRHSGSSGGGSSYGHSVGHPRSSRPGGASAEITAAAAAGCGGGAGSAEDADCVDPLLAGDGGLGPVRAFTLCG